VLVEQRFRRVGGEQDVQVDVRVVSSTSKDARTEIADGRFREDLFHRLNVVPVRVPGLTERREDIAELVEYFIERIAEATGLPRRKLGEDSIAILQAHEWPGNVRQLRNNIERMLILATGIRRRSSRRTSCRRKWRRRDPTGRCGRSRSSPCPCERRANCSSAST
jgi:two-component system nitrogen regulation response regulator NtrX